MTYDRSLSIALVEADRSVRDALRRTLESMGHRVPVRVATEREVLDHLALVDLVIVDHDPPFARAPEIAARLQARRPDLAVVLSTRGWPEAGSPWLTLRKPFDRAQLSRALKQAVWASAA